MTGPWQIVEGIAGMWHYHLAHVDSPPHKSLCGKQTMSTMAQLSSWGFMSKHIPTSYCVRCEQLAKGAIDAKTD